MKKQTLGINEIEAWEESDKRIKVLLVVSNPVDELVKINATKEVEDIFRQLSSSNVSCALIRLNPPTWQHMFSTLLARKFDIVHFIGHSKSGAVQLEKENGVADWVKVNDFSNLMSNTNIQVLFLNSCSSESISNDMIISNIPVVISMTKNIKSQTSLLIANSVYSSLSAGKTFKETHAITESILSREISEDKNIFTIVGPNSDDKISDTIPVGKPIYYPSKPINNLPPIYQSVFVNRTNEMMSIYSSMVSSNSPYIGITGIAGAGKSAFTIAAANRYAWRFNNGIAYISLRQSKEFSLITLFNHFEWGIDDFTESKQLSVVLHELSQGAFLIIIDDIENADEKELNKILKLLNSWDTSLGGRAILTMRKRRQEFDDLVLANWINIEHFSFEASLNLIHEHFGSSHVSEAILGDNIEKLPDLCYGHAKLLISTISAIQSGVPWHELTQQFENFSGGPIKQFVNIFSKTIEQIEKEEPTTILFLDSWSIFSSIAIEKIWRYVISSNSMQDDIHWNKQNNALSLLQRAQVIQRFEENSEVKCSVHPLIGEFLKKHRWKKLSITKQKNYIENHIDYYINHVNSFTKAIIVKEWENISSTISQNITFNNLENVIKLCEILAKPQKSILIETGLWSYAKRICEIGRTTAEKLSSQSREIYFRLQLGKVYYRLTEYQNSGKEFKYIYDNAIGKDVEIDIEVHKELGRIAYRLTDYSKASEYFDKAYSISISKLNTNEVLISDVLDEIGRLSYRMKDYEKAIEVLNKSLIIEKKHNDYKGIGRTLLELARVYHKKGDLSKAEAIYKESIDIRRENNDLIGLQSSLHQYALLMFETKKLDIAKTYYNECIELSNSLKDRFWIAHNDFRYSKLLWELGQKNKATSLAIKSLETCKLLEIGLKKNVEKWLTEINN